MANLDFEHSLYHRLAGISGPGDLQAVLSTRIYPVRLPQSPTYPALVYSLIAAAPEYTRDGNGLEFVTVQFDCFATSYGAALSVEDALEDLFDGFSGTMGSAHTDTGVTIGSARKTGKRDLNVDEAGTDGYAGIFRRSVDWRFSVTDNS